MFTVDTSYALFISVIANGIVYVAGLSYVNIRAEKKERPMKIALCHAWKVVGIALVLSLFVYGVNNNPDIKVFYRVIGYIIIGSSAIFICLLMFNEFSQRQGLLYNYRDCLDHDNAIANNYCKLFSRNEVIIERNPTVSSAGLWKSTENLLPRSKENYTNWWTVFLLLPKLHGSITFHWLLMYFTMAFSTQYLEWNYSAAVLFWIMAGGSILGVILLRFFNSAKVYAIASILGVTMLAITYAFYKLEYKEIAITLWVYFLTVSIASAVPDLALMEVAKIRFSEGALAVGFFLEIITIAVLQYVQVKYIFNPDLFEKHFLATLIMAMVILVVTSVLYQLFMPNTSNKSLLQIQNELLKYKKFFVFTFEEDVNVAVPRRSSESNNYQANNNVNVFENHEKNISSTVQVQNDYSEVMERLPDPPVNKVTNYDYSKEVPKPPAIIPRVNIAKSQTSLYANNLSNK